MKNLSSYENEKEDIKLDQTHCPSSISFLTILSQMNFLFATLGNLVGFQLLSEPETELESQPKVLFQSTFLNNFLTCFCQQMPHFIIQNSLF
jgi:hypothetical protein